MRLFKMLLPVLALISVGFAEPVKAGNIVPSRKLEQAVDAHLQSRRLKAKMPRVTSKSDMMRYMQLFGDACLRSNPRKAGPVFEAAGLRPFDTRELYVPNNGWLRLPKQNAIFNSMSPTYQKLSLKLRRPDGLVPLLQGRFAWIGDAGNTYSDGKVIASFSKKGACRIELKVNDIRGLAAALTQVINETGFSSGPMKNLGLLGQGFQSTKSKLLFVVFGRNSSAKSEPTHVMLVKSKR